MEGSSGGPFSKMHVDLTCSICTDTFKKPKVLSCGHTFCLRPCLEDLIGDRSNFRCPLCRTVVTVPQRNPNKFADNYVLMSVIDQLKAQESTESSFKVCCKHCLPMGYYCEKCDRPICSTCKTTEHVHDEGDVLTWDQIIPKKIAYFEVVARKLTLLGQSQEQFKKAALVGFQRDTIKSLNSINGRLTFMTKLLSNRACAIVNQIKTEMAETYSEFIGEQTQFLKRIEETKKMAQNALLILDNGKLPEAWVEKDIDTTMEELQKISSNSKHSQENPYLKLKGRVIIKEEFQEDFADYDKVSIHEGGSESVASSSDLAEELAASTSNKDNLPKKGFKHKGLKNSGIPTPQNLAPSEAGQRASTGRHEESSGSEVLTGEGQDGQSDGRNVCTQSGIYEGSPKGVSEKSQDGVDALNSDQSRCGLGSQQTEAKKDASSKDIATHSEEVHVLSGDDHHIAKKKRTSSLEESDGNKKHKSDPSHLDICEIMRDILLSKKTRQEQLSVMLSTVHNNLETIFPGYDKKVPYAELRKLWKEVGQEVLNNPIKEPEKFKRRSSMPVLSVKSSNNGKQTEISSMSYARRPLYRLISSSPSLSTSNQPSVFQSNPPTSKRSSLTSTANSQGHQAPLPLVVKSASTSTKVIKTLEFCKQKSKKLNSGPVEVLDVESPDGPSQTLANVWTADDVEVWRTKGAKVHPKLDHTAKINLFGSTQSCTSSSAHKKKKKEHSGAREEAQESPCTIVEDDDDSMSLGSCSLTSLDSCNEDIIGISSLSSEDDDLTVVDLGE